MNAMKYSVTIMEHGAERERETWHLFTGRTLSEAWRIVEQHARRGFNRYGGEIARHNWGARGGSFPKTYRSATIRADFL